MQNESFTKELIQSSLFTVAPMKGVVTPSVASKNIARQNKFSAQNLRVNPRVSMQLQKDAFNNASAKFDFSVKPQKLQMRSNSTENKIAVSNKLLA